MVYLGHFDHCCWLLFSVYVIFDVIKTFFVVCVRIHFKYITQYHTYLYSLDVHDHQSYVSIYIH